MEQPDARAVPRYEKVTWLLIVVFLIIAFAIFWVFGFSRLPFPV